jgi:hypothetical protein
MAVPTSTHETRMAKLQYIWHTIIIGSKLRNIFSIVAPMNEKNNKVETPFQLAPQSMMIE